MNKVSYTLMKMNREIKIKYCDLETTLRIRDLYNILKGHECEITDDHTLIIGPNINLEIAIDSINKGSK